MSAVLRRLGFDVIEKINLGLAGMNEAIETFGERIQPGGVALFYYAGHGMQVSGANYLIPVDANINKENEIRYKSVDAGLVLAKMESAKSDVNIAIMDACRDNPFARSFRSTARGLAQVDAPSGTLIAFATGPGKTAADGEGRNGVYTEALMEALESPGVPLEHVFKQVRKLVLDKTGSVQTPWESSSLVGDFYFIPPSGSELRPASTQVTIVPRPQASPPPPARSDTLTDPTTGMEFLLVNAGCFQMGDTFGDGEEDEKPVHEVCVNDIYMGKHEVTKGQFNTFVQATGYRTEAEQGKGCFVWDGSKWKEDRSASWRSFGSWQDDSHPVVCVTHSDGRAFADWVSGKLNRHVRLPTEAEWEYAARSGGKGQKYSGGFNLDAVGWYKDNSGMRTNPVGRKEANGLGLFDMTGNVWEWCSDWYDKTYYGSSPKDNPQGPSSGSDRVGRGGGWGSEVASTRAASRNYIAPGYRGYDLGFRLVSPVQ